jgi:hypothetical protein
MADNDNNGGCNIWLIIIIIALVTLCDRVDKLEHKNDPNVTIEIPK